MVGGSCGSGQRMLSRRLNGQSSRYLHQTTNRSAFAPGENSSKQVVIQF